MRPDPGWASGSCGNPQIDYVGQAERALMRPHVAVRPAWDCESCGDPWPCDPAKVILSEEFGPRTLRVVMAVFAHEAARDLTTDRPLYPRMLGWITVWEAVRGPRAVGSARVLRRR